MLKAGLTWSSPNLVYLKGTYYENNTSWDLGYCFGSLVLPHVYKLRNKFAHAFFE